jgi:hypothetical protein
MNLATILIVNNQTQLSQLSLLVKSTFLTFFSSELGKILLPIQVGGTRLVLADHQSYSNTVLQVHFKQWLPHKVSNREKLMVHCRIPSIVYT